MRQVHGLVFASVLLFAGGAQAFQLNRHAPSPHLNPQPLPPGLQTNIGTHRVGSGAGKVVVGSGGGAGKVMHGLRAGGDKPGVTIMGMGRHEPAGAAPNSANGGMMGRHEPAGAAPNSANGGMMGRHEPAGGTAKQRPRWHESGPDTVRPLWRHE
jgi:hypothetical protein